MKALLTALLSALLCVVSSAAPPAQITVGPQRVNVEPKGSVIAGHKSVEVPARLTNASDQPIWIYAQRREFPFYSTFSRASAQSSWTLQTEPLCEVAASFHKLDPGSSLAFKARFPYTEGHQFRIEVDTYRAPV